MARPAVPVVMGGVAAALGEVRAGVGRQVGHRGGIFAAAPGGYLSLMR